MSTIGLLAALSMPGSTPDEDGARFAAPTPIHEAAAEAIAGLLYPSPVLHDVDGDGALEMILGDLRGSLWVCERLENTGPMGWSAPKALESDGQPLKFDNW